MSKYKGLFTFDEDNHKYIPIAQADGIIDTMDYEPDAKPEPLIKDEKIRKAVRAWAEANRIKEDSYEDRMLEFDRGEHQLKWIETSIEFNEPECLEGLEDGEKYTIEELCGEEEE